MRRLKNERGRASRRFKPRKIATYFFGGFVVAVFLIITPTTVGTAGRADCVPVDYVYGGEWGKRGTGRGNSTALPTSP